MVGTPKYTEEQINFICARRYERPQSIVDACTEQFPRSRVFTASGIRYVLNAYKDRPSDVNPTINLIGALAGHQPNSQQPQAQYNQVMSQQAQNMHNPYPQRPQSSTPQMIAQNGMVSAHRRDNIPNRAPQAPNPQMAPHKLQQLQIQLARLTHLQNTQRQLVKLQGRLGNGAENQDNQSQPAPSEGAEVSAQDPGNSVQLGPFQSAQVIDQDLENIFQQSMFQGARVNAQGQGNTFQRGPIQDAQFNAQGLGNLSQHPLFQGAQIQPGIAQPPQRQPSQPMVPAMKQPHQRTSKPISPVQFPINIQASANGFSTDQADDLGKPPNNNQADECSSNMMSLPASTPLTMPVAPLRADTAAQDQAHCALDKANQSTTPNTNTMDVPASGSLPTPTRAATPIEEPRYHPVPRSSPYHLDNQLPSTPNAKLADGPLEKDICPAEKILAKSAVPAQQHGNIQALTNNASSTLINNTANNAKKTSANEPLDSRQGLPGDDLCALERMVLGHEERNEKPKSVTYNIFDPVYKQKLHLPGSDSGWKVSMKEQNRRPSTNSSQGALPDFTISGGKNVIVNLYRPKFLAGMGYEPAGTPNAPSNNSNVHDTGADYIVQSMLTGLEIQQPQQSPKRPAQDKGEETVRPAKRAKATPISQPSTPKKSAPEVDVRGLLTPPHSSSKAATMTAPTVVNTVMHTHTTQASVSNISMVIPASTTKVSPASIAKVTPVSATLSNRFYNMPAQIAKTMMYTLTPQPAISNVPKTTPALATKVSPAPTNTPSTLTTKVPTASATLLGPIDNVDSPMLEQNTDDPRQVEVHQSNLALPTVQQVDDPVHETQTLEEEWDAFLRDNTDDTYTSDVDPAALPPNESFHGDLSWLHGYASLPTNSDEASSGSFESMAGQNQVQQIELYDNNQNDQCHNIQSDQHHNNEIHQPYNDLDFENFDFSSLQGNIDFGVGDFF
ncbi:uncharacterized protein BP5553_08533 [Venustampulla echinocandica]|uniref:Uncharacterized protein n=1 Tax=Venustampulla echinocandica TaxID=2656787 RepID=A0A370TEH4_9HELO|nr:uncharacterized protein BP5553_08533 [Venustampulla echinocandica]RDL33094.1 hypothetical protein BP5553_08533 [Venustampulla echinocandica]